MHPLYHAGDPEIKTTLAPPLGVHSPVTDPRGDPAWAGLVWESAGVYESPELAPDTALEEVSAKLRPQKMRKKEPDPLLITWDQTIRTEPALSWSFHALPSQRRNLESEGVLTVPTYVNFNFSHFFSSL